MTEPVDRTGEDVTIHANVAAGGLAKNATETVAWTPLVQGAIDSGVYTDLTERPEPTPPPGDPDDGGALEDALTESGCNDDCITEHVAGFLREGEHDGNCPNRDPAGDVEPDPA